MSDVDLVEAIRRCSPAAPFVGEGYRKVWASCDLPGLRTRKERVLRLMREQGLAAPSRVGGARGPRIHDGTIIPRNPNALWGTDLTNTVTIDDGQVAVFVAVDHCTAELRGRPRRETRGTRYEALEPLRQGVRRYFGRIDEERAQGLTLRHDHGSQYLSDALPERARVPRRSRSTGVRPRPEGNGCAERVIRTLKEQLLWVKSFATVEELRLRPRRVEPNLQRKLDDRAARASLPGPVPTRHDGHDADGRQSQSGV